METKLKATPGPWHVVLSDNATPHIMHEHGDDCSDYSDRGSLVCVMPAEIMQCYNSLANARLIAAAPDLYAALEAMLEVHGVTQEYADKHIEIPQSWVEASEIARAALKRARGES